MISALIVLRRLPSHIAIAWSQACSYRLLSEGEEASDMAITPGWLKGGMDVPILFLRSQEGQGGQNSFGPGSEGSGSQARPLRRPRTVLTCEAGTKTISGAYSQFAGSGT